MNYDYEYFITCEIMLMLVFTKEIFFITNMNFINENLNFM